MGRDKKNERRVEHFTTILRHMIDTPAWRALLPNATCLYLWLCFEWRGPKANNNGKLRLSLRQAAERMGCAINTVGRAFHDLQAKGFIHVTEGARLGTGGEGKSPCFEITEHPLPGETTGRKLYRGWSPGKDFTVSKAQTANPEGRNGKTKPCHQNRDSTVIEMKTRRPRASPK